MRIRLSYTDTHTTPLAHYTPEEAAARAVQAGDRPSRPLRALSISPPVALPREKRGSQLQAAPAQRRAAGLSCEQ